MLHLQFPLMALIVKRHLIITCAGFIIDEVPLWYRGSNGNIFDTGIEEGMRSHSGAAETLLVFDENYRGTIIVPLEQVLMLPKSYGIAAVKDRQIRQEPF